MTGRQTDLAVVITGANRASPAFVAAEKDAKAFGQVINADSKEVLALQERMVMLNRQHSLGTLTEKQHSAAMKELTADTRALAAQANTTATAEAALARTAQQAMAAAGGPERGSAREARRMDSLVMGMGALAQGGEGAAGAITKVTGALTYLTASNPELFMLVTTVGLLVAGWEAVTKAEEGAGDKLDRYNGINRVRLQALIAENQAAMIHARGMTDHPGAAAASQLAIGSAGGNMAGLLGAAAALVAGSGPFAKLSADENEATLTGIDAALHRALTSTPLPEPNHPRGRRERATRDDTYGIGIGPFGTFDTGAYARDQHAREQEEYRRAVAPIGDHDRFQATMGSRGEQDLFAHNARGTDLALRRLGDISLDPQVEAIRKMAEHMQRMAEFSKLSTEAFGSLVGIIGSGGHVFDKFARQEAASLSRLAAGKAVMEFGEGLSSLANPLKAGFAGHHFAAAAEFTAAALMLGAFAGDGGGGGGGAGGSGGGGGGSGSSSGSGYTGADRTSQQHTTQLIFVTPDGRELSRQIVQTNARQERLGAPSTARIPLNAVVLAGPVTRA